MPNASESGRLRPGFFTSAAVKVTLFQASIAKSEPTIATPISVNGGDHPRGIVGRIRMHVTTLRCARNP